MDRRTKNKRRSAKRERNRRKRDERRRAERRRFSGKSPQSEVPAPSFLRRADETAPWTKADREYFAANPQAYFGYRPPFPDEVEMLVESGLPGAVGDFETLRSFGAECPTMTPGILVVRARAEGVRLRCPVLMGPFKGHPFVAFMAASGGVVAITEEIMEGLRERADQTLNPKGSQDHLDFCGTCGQEIPLGSLEFLFGDNRNHCPLCSLGKLEGESPMAVGVRFPTEPDDAEWSEGARQRFTKAKEALKGLQGRLHLSNLNYAERQQLKQAVAKAAGEPPC